MMDTLKNRGPDNQDIYIDKKNKFLIGHTRLSIIDVDKRSNQPMDYHGCIISFNGEIYNYKKIKRKILPDFKFETESDTEVIIALYKEFGINGWKYLEGMFAFILYDKQKNKKYFLRDPVGIKPLYFYTNDSKLAMSSKIQTLLKVINPTPNINKRAVNDILALGYPRVPIYDKIYECVPGEVYDEKLKKYDIDFIVDKSKTIKDAIKEQFINSHRPIGILLSGGIDSTYIAYVCSKINKVHTFTIGFSRKDPDVVAAKKFAKFIKSEHHEILINKGDFEKNLWEGIDKIGFPTDLGSVSLVNAIGKEVAKTDIKVLLSGDGNDEISGGYKRYYENSGIRTVELVEWYKKRIIKNDYEKRKEILKDDVFEIVINSVDKFNNSNIILWIDYKNELLYYHLKRMDHIISDFGIELRVPYLDYSFIMNSFSKPFSSKVSKRGNKLLVRDFALKDGLPMEFAFGPKIPMKPKDFNTKEHLVRIWKKWEKY